MHEGIAAAEAIAGSEPGFEHNVIPFVIYTEPEVAECGLSEGRAKKENRPVNVARFPWAASGRAATMGRSEGLTKLILDPDTERVLGAGIAGTNAGELVGEIALAIRKQATAGDLASTMHLHPTLSETLPEAAAVFLGRSLHLYRPKRR